MKCRCCGPGVVYWCIADAIAIAVAIGWPGWLLSVLTWLILVIAFVTCGRIPVWRPR